MSIQSDDTLSRPNPARPVSGIVGAGPSREILQKYIDAGDITTHDIEVINKAYINMSTMGGLCTAVLGIGSYVWMSRTTPPIPRVRRIMVSATFGMVGSFIGWVIGGVGAYNAMTREMSDPQQKIDILRQVAEETREAIGEAYRAGRPIAGANRGGWTDPATRERREELNREREAARETGRVESDLLEVGASSPGIAQSVKQETSSTWDRLRLDKPAGLTPPSGLESQSGLSSNEDTRTQEQREFDALLERERRGVDTIDKWS